jgi:uncharacterized SAM-binding protein YcdF (DUF218 family)
MNRASPIPRPAFSRKRESGILRALLGLVIALAVTAAAGALVFFELGHWLVVEDPIGPARAIVVLSGDMPMRAIEAARLYHDHDAPEVWVTHPWGAQQALAPYGIAYVGDAEYNREVLEKLGVPAASIRILEPRIVNTAAEVRVIADELHRVGGQQVIVVTSPIHTRRVKTIWRELVGNDPEAIVRYTRADAFDASRWWENTDDAFDAVREVLGLANAWAGFPIRPSPPARSVKMPRPPPQARGLTGGSDAR